MKTDEEIKQAGKDYRSKGVGSMFDFIAGAKWYREQSQSDKQGEAVAVGNYIAERSKHSWFNYDQGTKKWYDPITSEHLTTTELYTKFINREG